MYIKRILQSKIEKYINKPEIIAVIGPRQCGKTTLFREIFKGLKKAVFLDFEDRDVLELFNNDIKSFYNLHVKGCDYLFIDEFQYANKGGQGLKYLYDTYKIKILISGSSALELTNQAVKYLVGRIFIFNLFPFNFDEFLSFRNPALYKNIFLNVKKQLNDYLYTKDAFPPEVVSKNVINEIYNYYKEFTIFGGYPRVVIADDNEEKITILKNIYNTYFLREIRDILQLSTEEQLGKIIKALSLQTGSSVIYNELSQLTSLNYEGVIKHLNILEKTFVIKRVLPFYTNKRLEIAKAPKIYFLDNGLKNTVISNFDSLEDRVDRGSLNENFIASELVKDEHNLNYWRTKSNAEVDFIIEENRRNIAIEVKSTLNTGKVERGLLNFKEKYNPDKIIIASETYFSFEEKRDLLFIPIFFI